MIQKEKVVELKESVKFITGGFDKLDKESKSINTQIELLKKDNVKLSEIADKVKEGGKLSKELTIWTTF